jgi:hypothetical protein
VPANNLQTAVTVTANLTSGTYTLYRTLKPGQPDSHFELGMHATLMVR